MTTSTRGPLRRVVVLIPTYNERENLPRIVARVRASVPAADILVLEDNSPDGTGDVVRKLAAEHNAGGVLRVVGDAGRDVPDVQVVPGEVVRHVPAARGDVRGLRHAVEEDLLGGDAGRLAELERRVAAHLGFPRTFDSVGQVYPRSLDFDAVTALAQACAAPVSYTHLTLPTKRIV